MRIDMHCHVVGEDTKDINEADTKVFFKPEDNFAFLPWLLYQIVKPELINMNVDINKDGKISSDEYLSLIYNILISSKEIDGIVLLALDAVYCHKIGILKEKETDLFVTNKLLSRKVKELNKRLKTDLNPNAKRKKFFFGASVNPNRKNWKEELEYVLFETDAVLVKLIPSVQHINLMDDKHTDFYKMLSAKKMPLLCHVGREHSFAEGVRKKNWHLDNYENLEKPLECGVTVIAAHCSAPVFPGIEKNVIKEFRSFMGKHNSSGKIKLYADTSALSLSTRMPIIPDIVKTFPPEWLVNGSDLPIPIKGWTHLPLIKNNITFDEYNEFLKTTNVLDKDVKIKRAYGFSDSILDNAEKVLRLV